MKQKSKKKIGNWIVQGSRVFILIVMLAALWQGYKIVDYWQDHPQKEYTWNVRTEEPPKEVLTKAKLNREARNIMLIGAFFILLAQVGMYIREPENHWFTAVKNKIDNMEGRG